MPHISTGLNAARCVLGLGWAGPSLRPASLRATPSPRRADGEPPTQVTRPSRASRGQATVELAVSLPFVVAALLLVLQVGLVVRAQVLVVHAAREAARA